MYVNDSNTIDHTSCRPVDACTPLPDVPVVAAPIGIVLLVKEKRSDRAPRKDQRRGVFFHNGVRITPG